MRIFIICIISVIAMAAFAQDISLEDSYKAALSKETTVIKNKSVKGQSRARLKQARSYLFPSVNLTGRYEESTFEEKDTGISTDGTSRTASAVLRQPLFQGGLFSGVQREKALDQLTDLQIRQSDLDLYLEVAQSYYKIQILESTLEVVKDVNDVSSKRVGILKRRAKIGKSKQTDILTNEIQFQALKIELSKVESDLAAERERFGNLTGLATKVSLKKLAEVPVLKPFSYYSNKMNQTLDIEIQSKNLYIAEKNESIKTMQHLPKLYLDLEANYTDYGTTSSSRDGKEYAGAVILELPLFLGGRTSAEAQEAEWKKREEKNKLNLLKQDVSVGITNQYNEFKKWIDLYKIYEESLATAKKNYQVFNKESNLGLVSNLELLNSLTTYLDTKKGRDEAFYQLKISELELARLVGERN